MCAATSTTIIGDLHYVKTSDIYEKAAALSKQKANKFLTKPKKNKDSKPFPSIVSDITDFPFEHEEGPVFLTDQNFSGTYIAFNVTPYPEYLQEEKISFREVFDNILFQTRKQQYFRKLLINRSSTMMSPSTSSMSKDRYISFVKDLGKLVYKEFYDKKAETDAIDLDKIKDLEEAEQKDQELLNYDLFNQSTLSTITSLYEVFDKLTDDEIENCAFLSSHSFIHPSHWLLSPPALALSFFNSQLMFLKKPYKDDLYYTKHSLPRVTYISMTGIYSEMDIDLLRAFSENIQTVVIYDEDTGGTLFSRNEESNTREDLRSQKRNLQEISEKLLLISLQNAKKKKSFSPKDLARIVKKIVVPAVGKFKPSYIVLNCSFDFNNQKNAPFFLDPENISKIINHLQQICNNKIVVFPFKLPNQENKETANLFNRVLKKYAPENQKEHLRNIIQEYGVPSNALYTQEILVSTLEALTSFKKSPVIKKKWEINAKDEVRYHIAKQSQENPYHMSLYSIHLKDTSGTAKETIENLKRSSKEDYDKLNNNLSLNFPPEDDRKECEEDIYGRQLLVSEFNIETNVLDSLEKLPIDRDLIISEKSQRFSSNEKDNILKSIIHCQNKSKTSFREAETQRNNNGNLSQTQLLSAEKNSDAGESLEDELFKDKYLPHLENIVEDDPLISQPAEYILPDSRNQQNKLTNNEIADHRKDNFQYKQKLRYKNMEKLEELGATNLCKEEKISPHKTDIGSNEAQSPDDDWQKIVTRPQMTKLFEHLYHGMKDVLKCVKMIEKYIKPPEQGILDADLLRSKSEEETECDLGKVLGFEDDKDSKN